MEHELTFEQIFQKYADMIYRIGCSYLKDAGLAEDLVQDVFLKYLKKAPEFESEEHRKAWLLKVAVNRAKSLVMSAWCKRNVPLEEEADTLRAPEREEDSLEFLSYLPAKYAVVLYLRYYEEYSVNEIAKLLHLTPNNVSARLGRGRKKLKEYLQGMEQSKNQIELQEI